MQEFLELWGCFGLFVVMIVQVIIPPIPAEGIVIVAVKSYGIPKTSACTAAGLWVGSVLVYYIGRYLKAKLARFFDREKVRRIIAHIRHHENFMLWLRILPYNPSDSISYAAGIVSVPVAKFVWISLVTSICRCVMLALLGFSITSWDKLLQAGSVLILSALGVHVILFARKKDVRASGLRRGRTRTDTDKHGPAT